jgi:signal transduction histidine kinase
MTGRPDQVLSEPLRPGTRDALALGLAALAFLVGTVAFAFGRPASGVYLSLSGQYLVVREVSPWSEARLNGIEPGMVVVQLNGRLLVPVRDGQPAPAFDELVQLENAPIEWLEAAWPDTVAELAKPDTGSGVTTFGFNSGFGFRLDQSGFAPLLGIAILVTGGWFLATGRGGPSIQPLAIPIAAATAVPLLLTPAYLLNDPSGFAWTGLLGPIAMLPLADGLTSTIADEPLRRRVRALVLVVAALAIAVGTVLMLGDAPGRGLSAMRGVLVGSVPFLAGLVAARPNPPAILADGPSPSGRLVQSTELVVAGATPGIALLTPTFTTYEPFVLPILLWIVGILVAGRFTIRPLARLATRAQLQRDLVVAAMEAERARLAADLHDEALQELILLVRRLDAAGDEEGAALGRTVADRLRAICGDLRLPILDDLGVGPALDWLVVRIERLAGGEVRLERADGTRPPPDVELAVFRVAQEALANAVKHGRPPIVVRYRATSSGVSLSIDDAGPGIEPRAGEEATAGGHFGLLNMQQRAEQIGAILDVRRWPGGGTHVALEWRPR